MINLNLRLVSFILVIVIVMLLSPGCDKPKENLYGVERLSFDVVDSLIGTAFMVEKANKAVCPPIDCIPIADSLLDLLKQRQKLAAADFGEIEMAQMFVDSTNNFGLIVSEVSGLLLMEDTSVFIDKYTEALYKHYGKDNVKTGNYVVNDILVNNYLVTGDQYIRFQLLCMSEKSPALELQYFASKENYPALIKKIESSIGTVSTN